MEAEAEGAEGEVAEVLHQQTPEEVEAEVEAWAEHSPLAQVS